MGIFNVFKLANDYAKLKKYLNKNKYKVKEVEELVDKCLEHVRYLKRLRDQLNDFIRDFKETIDVINAMLKGDK